MAPSAVDEPADAAAVDIKMTDTRTFPPPNIYPVKEMRFEKYIEPQPDGRKRALEQPDSAAIVIDNGKILPHYPGYQTQPC